MNKLKISKIMGVGLALLMVLSLAFALMPTKAQADEGNMTWLAQPLPGTGDALGNVLLGTSNVTEFAVASNGLTMYAINGAANASAAAAPWALYKSVDAGQSWVGVNLSVPCAAFATPLGNVAVAPDNPDVVAISTRDPGAGTNDTVFVSSSGTISFAPLPAPLGAAAGLAILDLKVGPARADAILGREYLIACSNEAAGVAANLSSLQIIGAAEVWGATGTAWSNLLTLSVPAVANSDFLACEFSPSYIGDRVVVGVGGAAAATNVYAFSTQGDVLLNIAGIPDQLSGTFIAYDETPGANSCLAADIALSPDFDFSNPGYDKVYASVTAYTGAPPAVTGNVYRDEQGLPVATLFPAGQAIKSIAFAGDAFGGTLFAGDYTTTALITRVRYTTQPVINSPTWYPARKPPTGGGVGLGTVFSQGFIRLSPNFLSDQTVFCGTSDGGASWESAFSVSTDAGVSFNQESLIDSIGVDTVVQVDSIAYAPDGTTLFMATNDNPGGAGELSLWKTATAPTPTSWTRIYCFTKNAGANTGVLTINRGLWADFPEIYFAESPAVALRFFVSTDGGNLFLARSAPVLGTAIPAGGIATAGPKEAYVAQGTNIFKTTTGAAGAWGPPRPSFIIAIIGVAVAPNGDVIASGVGGVTRSTDGGTTFAPVAGYNGLALPGAYVCLPDYMGNYPIAYAWNLLAAPNNVFRINVDTGTVWENLANPGAAALVGFGQSNGALYAMTAALGCDRTIMPTFAVGDMLWGTMNVPVGAVPAGVDAGLVDVANSKMYVCNGVGAGAPLMWAYNDSYATLKTTVNTPASGATISIDPVTGRADTLQFSWSPVGTGTGLATNYLVAIFEKSQGFPGAILNPTGAMPLPSSPSNAIYPAAVAGAVAPDINYTFLAGNEYGIMFSALNQVSGDSFTGAVLTDLMFSAWSDPIFIAIEAGSGVISPPHGGPLLNAPSLDATATGVDVGLSWAPMSGVTEYELIIATDAALTATVAGTPVTLGTTSFGTSLDFDKVYYYGVRATAPTSSVQTTDTFTMAKPVEKYTCQYDGLTFDTRAELEAHIAAAHAPTTPAYIWFVIAIGAILVIAVIVLIVRTRRA